MKDYWVLIRVKAASPEDALREAMNKENHILTNVREVPEIHTAVKPIPRDQWPLWAKGLAKFAAPEDKGIGDVAARMIGAENSAKFKAWHLATFGRPCGCNGRRHGLNIKYPLP